MQTLNYIGSKKTLFNSILSVCKWHISDLDNRNFADLFAGTGTVAFNMKKYCKKIEANDLEYYSYIINSALLKCNYSKKLEKIIKECNNLDPIEGLIYKNFSPDGDSHRMFFINDNSKKCDSMRQYIHSLYSKNKITVNEYNFLLASLLVSIDKVANTSSVYGAYLKKFKKSALKDIILKPIHTSSDNLNCENEVYNFDIEELVKDKKFDIVYLDPPYNHRQYSCNYSPLNYIAQYDKNINLNGKTGLMPKYNKSSFCSKVNAKTAFTNLINNLECNYIILSYNNEGLLKFDDLKEILLKKGNIILYKIKYNKFKAQNTVRGKIVEEYIWFIDVNKKENKFYTANFAFIAG